MEYNPPVVLHVEETLEIMRTMGREALSHCIIKATTVDWKNQSIRVDEVAIFGFEQAAEISRNHGLDALCLFFFLEGVHKSVTQGELSELLGMTLAETQEAVYQLGCWYMSIQQEKAVQ